MPRECAMQLNWIRYLARAHTRTNLLSGIQFFSFLLTVTCFTRFTRDIVFMHLRKVRRTRDTFFPDPIGSNVQEWRKFLQESSEFLLLVLRIFSPMCPSEWEILLLEFTSPTEGLCLYWDGDCHLFSSCWNRFSCLRVGIMFFYLRFKFVFCLSVCPALAIWIQFFHCCTIQYRIYLFFSIVAMNQKMQVTYDWRRRKMLTKFHQSEKK